MIGSNLLLKPQLAVKEIQDTYLRKNFENMVDYFGKENQLLGFKFFEVSFTTATSNKKIAHGLGSIPQDIIVTRVTGDGDVSFNWGLFDSQNIDVSVTGACRVRFFVGSYWNFITTLSNTPNDISQFSGLVSAIESGSGAGSVSSITAATSYSSTINDANDVVLINAIGAGATVSLPPLSAAVGTGLYRYKKVDVSFNVVQLQTAGSDKIDSNTVSGSALSTSTRLVTEGESVTLLPTKERWVIFDRNHISKWKSLNWVAATLTTNALANPVTLNGGLDQALPNSYWRRDGSNVRQRFGFRNGSVGGTATGVAGIVSMPLVPGLTVDLTTTPNTPVGLINGGFASVTHNATDLVLPVANLEIPNGAIYFRITDQGGSTYYTLSEINNGFAAHGELCYSIVGWEG